MSSLGSVKFKMHRAVNYIFYACIFFVGFLIGAGFKLFNIMDLIKNLAGYLNVL